MNKMKHMEADDRKLTITEPSQMNPVLPIYFLQSRHGHWLVVHILILGFCNKFPSFWS